MSKKNIFLLLLSAILLAGCKNSNKPPDKKPIAKDSVTISQKATTDVKKSTTTDIIVEDKDTNTNVKLPPLTSKEKTKVIDNVNSVVDSIDSVLNSQDEAKELDLN